MRHSCLLIAVFAAVVLPALAAQAAGDRLPARKLTPNEAARLPGGAHALERETVRQQVSGERWRQVHDMVGAQHVSAKSQRSAKARDVADTDTLRVLLVRIAFATDRSGPLTSVTEDGNFQLGEPSADDSLPIDPPPHDRAYFESHLRGLSEYYRYQSGGRLHIESRVLPEGDTDIYQLGDIADYGPGAGGFWTIDGLERLVLDMIAAADEGTQADGSVDLSDYADGDPSTYIIFVHAGSDWQSDVNQDSPNDIPTFFVTLGEAAPLISGGMLSECSVIPETTNQDGYKGSIAAALYHEFGHALGLVDVYDATTGLTSVGIWDLMDSGTNLAANLGVDTNDDGQADTAISVTGILPPSLGAWNKWYLGWADVDTLGGETRTVKIPAVGVLREQYPLYAFDPGDPQLLVAGASPREFFLIENRWVPLLESDTPFDPYDPVSGEGGIYFRSDPATGVVLYLAGQVNGVEVNTGLYDYFMPEGGLLVWHVNMDRIEANLATNSINMYGDGLKLVEADGIQDIGVLDSYVLGWYGSARDPFTPYNLEGSLLLEPAGRPHSRAYDRSLTGVHLWDIADDGDARGAVMRFEARVEPLAGQFPFMLDDRDDGPRALAPWSVTPLNGDLLLLADAPPAGQPATLFAITPAGEPAFAPVPGRPRAWAWELTDELAGPPAVGGGNVLAGTRDGRVTSLRLAAGAFEEAWHAAPADTLVAGPVPLDLAEGLRIVCATGPGELVLLDGSDGTPLGDPLPLLGPGSAPAAAITAAPRAWVRADDAIVACFGSLGWYEVMVTADGFDGAAEFHPYTSATAQTVVRPALVPGADEAPLEAHLVIPGLGAWRLTGNGTAEIAAWGGRLEEPLVSDPAVADLDGDGRNDIVAATSRTIHAWQADGTVLTGFPVGLSDLFPLPDSTRIAGDIVVADGTGDGLNEVFVTTHTGRLLGVGATGRLLEGTPFLCADGSAASLAAGQGTLYVANTGGYAGPPHDRHRINGRLVGYRLATAGAQGTSEWLGPLGGPLRAGPQGTLAALGPLSPLTALGDDVVIYPSPVRGGEATVRFNGAAGSDARLTLFTLEGQEILRLSFAAGDGPISEHTFPLDVASGVYLCRFEWEGSQGPTHTVTPLAVER